MGQGKQRSENEQELEVEGRERSFSIGGQHLHPLRWERQYGVTGEQRISEMEEAGGRGMS